MLTSNMTAISPSTGLPPLDAAYAQFLRAYPAFETTRALDALRATDYARLDQQGHVYLDYTGGGLYAESQLREHLALLSQGIFGNPHSQNLTSRAMTHLVEQTRAAVLAYFRASPDEYIVVFTQNATGALKLIGEAYPFDAGGTYLLTFDNHNSVNGIREFARARGAAVSYVPLVAPDLRVDPATLEHALVGAEAGKNNLFAYPAQSNFTGVQHPLEWIEQAQALGWDVLLDAAAFAPTNRLDLSRWHPDFVDLSFYKIFGYPTGVGCLLMRKAAARKLHRPWYAGGTLTFASVLVEDYYLTPGFAGFEDGTVNYLSLPAVELGLQHIERIGVELIHTRVMCLTGWLLDQLLALRHGNGQPLIRLYGPADTRQRGATIQINFLNARGRAHRLQARGAVGQRRAHLAAGRLSLQSRRARDSVGRDPGSPGVLFPGERLGELRAVPARDRWPDNRGAACFARPGDHVCGCLQVYALRRDAHRPPRRRLT